jgi:hypothetical protein
MWSSSSSCPPGVRTRLISSIAAAGSGMVHSDRAQTTCADVFRAGPVGGKDGRSVRRGRRDAVDGVVALTVVGELGIVSGDVLTRMTLDAVADDVKEVVVDLARVTWLDAAGVDAAPVRPGCRPAGGLHLSGRQSQRTCPVHPGNHRPGAAAAHQRERFSRRMTLRSRRAMTRAVTATF